MLNAYIIIRLILGQAESLAADAADTLALEATPTATKGLANPAWLWQEVAVAVVGGIALMLVVFLLGLPKKLWKRVRRRARAAKDSPLVSWSEFYGDDLDVRHRFEFVPDRKGVVTRRGETVVEESRPLETLLNWVDGGGRMMVICGTGGYGKSRLLIEAAKQREKRRKRLRFVRTRQAVPDFARLAKQVKEQAGKGDILVFEDCQEYAGDFGPLLDAALGSGARVIAATRYYGHIENALQRAHVTPEKLELGLMANAAQVVPTDDEEVLKNISRIAGGNPAIAVMAYLHYQRTDNLRGIHDAFELMQSVFTELVETGKSIESPDTREFLAEMAVRGGLWQDHAPYPGHERLVARLRKMGHIGQGGSPERRAYGVIPDQLRDHIIQEVYADGRVLQPEFSRVVQALPAEDAIHVVRMLGIQYRETGEDVWKQAVGLVLARYRQAPHEMLIDIGYEAWKQFGDVALVRRHLEDFCAGAEKLDSTAHLNKAGLYCMDTGQPDRAMACFEPGLKLAEARKDKSDQAMFLGNIGNICALKGETDKALNSFEEVLRLSEQMGWKESVANALGNIGLVYQDKGEPDKALKYHEDALAIAREIGYQQGVANQLGNIGLIWQDRGEPDKALEYQEKALKVFEGLGARQEQASVLGNIGNIWRRKGDLDKALEYQEKSLKASVEGGFRESAATALLNMGSIYIDKQDWQKAVACYVPSLMEHIAMGIADGPRQCLNGLRECRSGLGPEEFVSACVRAGMGKEEAEKLAEQLEKGEKLAVVEGAVRAFIELGPVKFIEKCIAAGMPEDDARKLAALCAQAAEATRGLQGEAPGPQ